MTNTKIATARRTVADRRLSLYLDSDTEALLNKARDDYARLGFNASKSELIRVALRQFIAGRIAA